MFASCSETNKFEPKEDTKFEAKVFTAGEGMDEVKVAVVKGTPYEMGHQLGSLLKEDITASLTYFLKAAQQEEPQLLSNEQLDKAWETNSPYIDNRVKEEMKGIAEGSGIDLKLFQRSHIIPLITPYSCSGVAVWGKGTANGHTLQIRNLDFTMDAKLQDHPVVVIYVPNEGTAHVNVSFAGYIASHTGMNANHLVFGEKGESPSSEIPYDLKGAHFSFLFRKMMYDTKNLDDILTTIKTTPLIKRYYLFFSDGNEATKGGAKILVSTPDEVKYHIWKDNNPEDNVAPNTFSNVIYHTMNNKVAAEIIKNNLGNFTPEKMIELSKAVADNENLMDVVYDATTLEMWVAYANGEGERAADRGYVHISMKEFLQKAGLEL
ncbi:MAG: hypothetical protein DSY82_02755 [Flavobacteriia bacterium]|nr:MAG: hypothetical protein DSY82_02755 [Flavobacteriia bacterium]